MDINNDDSPWYFLESSLLAMKWDNNFEFYNSSNSQFDVENSLKKQLFVNHLNSESIEVD